MKFNSELSSLHSYISVNRGCSQAILIYRIGKLGDTLIAMPAIQAIRNKFPDHRLLLLTEKHTNAAHHISSWDVLGPTGWFDAVVIYEVSSGLINKIKNFCKLFKQLRPLGIQHVYNLSPDRSPFQRKRDRFYFKNILRIPCYTDSKPFIPPAKNMDGTLPKLEAEWRRLLNLVQEARQECDYRLLIPQQFKGEAANKLDSHCIIPGQRIVAIAPGSKMPAKLWPIECFAQLGQHILEKYPDIALIVLGGKEDEDAGNTLCAGWGERAHNLAGQLSIYGSASLLEHCQLYVGNDTGTMHLAAMVGVPCVAIFSARDYPGKWEPFGRNHAILRHEAECSGCMLEVCDKFNECIKNVSVMSVKQQVISLLQGTTNKDKTT
ncbi:MAG: glycosyltransferase family 9 protein [Geobacteraceae bacterium]|nr:glycosyltransferase family 9 protein [Geobacteraceae bacterium]